MTSYCQAGCLAIVTKVCNQTGKPPLYILGVSKLLGRTGIRYGFPHNYVKGVSKARNSKSFRRYVIFQKLQYTEIQRVFQK